MPVFFIILAGVLGSIF